MLYIPFGEDDQFQYFLRIKIIIHFRKKIQISSRKTIQAVKSQRQSTYHSIQNDIAKQFQKIGIKLDLIHILFGVKALQRNQEQSEQQHLFNHHRFTKMKSNTQIILFIIISQLCYVVNASQHNDQGRTLDNDNQISSNDAILNCRTHSFSDHLPVVKLSTRDSWILLIGSSIALIIQISFFALAIKVPRLRQQPGDILLGCFCAEFILSIHWFIMSLEAILYPNNILNQDDAFCQLNSIISIFGSAMQGLYNFFFFLFIGLSIKSSLSIQSISRKKTHGLLIGTALLILITIFFLDLNGKTLYGTCSYVSDQSFPMLSLIFYLLFLFFSILILAYFNQKIPNTSFYKKKRKEFLHFSRLYLSVCLFMWGVIAISNTALFFNCQYVHQQYLTYFQTIGNTAKVLSSILLPMIRIKDPYLRSIIRQQKKILKQKATSIVPNAKTEQQNISNTEKSYMNDNTSSQNNQTDNSQAYYNKPKSQNQSYDDNSFVSSFSVSKEQISSLQQKYRDFKNKQNVTDDGKSNAGNTIIVEQNKNDNNESLSLQEIEERLSIFDNENQDNQKQKVEENQKVRKSNAAQMLSVQSTYQTQTFPRFQSSFNKSESIDQVGFKIPTGQQVKEDIENINLKQRNKTIFSRLEKKGNSIIKEENNSLDSNRSRFLSNKENKASRISQLQAFKFSNQSRTSQLKIQESSANQIQLPSVNSSMTMNSPINSNNNSKSIDSSNNIKNRSIKINSRKPSAMQKFQQADSILYYLDGSRQSSKMFQNRRNEFRKTLNQEVNKKRFNYKLFEYLKNNSIASELNGSQSYSVDASDQNRNVSGEEAILKQKLQQIIKNAQMMDYFNDPYYQVQNQSESGSFTDIDAVFGDESLSSGSSVRYGNSQLQAETFEDEKEHFIRILQKNIKMGVLCRILSGIQIHFMRKKRYCSKVDIFTDNYNSIFECQVNSIKLNKNSSQLSSQKSSVRYSQTGFYEQFKTLEDNKQETEQIKDFQNDKQQKRVKLNINNHSLNDSCHNQKNTIIYSNNLQKMEEENKNQDIFMKSENIYNKSNIIQLDKNSRQKSYSQNQQINLRQVSLSLTNNNNKKKSQKQQENDIFYEVKIFQFSDDSIKQNLNHAPTQLLDSDTFDLVRMRVYAPTVFHSLQQSEINLILNQEDTDPYKQKHNIDIENSFNIQLNMTQIKNASGSDGGKSGQFFFFSHDNKFLLKTCTEQELRILIERLPSYFRYLKANPRSLIAKIFGVYSFEGLNEKPIHLLLMKNIAACTKQFIERTYDLKGSTFDRQVLPKTKKESESFSRALNRMILKDLDFISLEKKIYISLENRFQVYNQLKRDSEFLKSCGWIDYSLIVFKINRKRHTEWKESNQVAYLEEEEDFDDQISHYYQFESTEQSGIYYHIGIIDYLQLYDIQKVLEKWAKRIIHFSPRLDTSSQDPETYSKRFINFMKQIFEI
ncbi:SecY subunit containing preprotein translocase (macronuclear) [Tetrahymena thermophila SB210]|uniref:SecY subunit containing preprotein translocase n=1 Tax=Tetrahymena thermophila (strain SB210) TaxID=312017 RepID=I7M6F7_TETTS|nr:SecY subunit containing preprotein translocase [Tetrahymena thermophila SB210]EAR85121.2 SecY subunit containing preprotein translocase [Tetrahymena thermophila SB210]|eukprot:XP_001032784.2 SecY subunit containing preprotein translocase [Tetrahymena thermophila SB210]